MTSLKPFLIVKRLVVKKSGHKVYDQKFHDGVNIIRGKNSSGKSSVVDLLFYGLGGDQTKWKPEALSCDEVFVEASLSGNIFVLQREISNKSKQSMQIFEGNYESAESSGTKDWLRYPYASSDNKDSFYQVIFSELGIPFAKSEDNNSITMHQLLRLMYVDQMTSLDRIFKFDQYDSANKRNAIGELMIGLSDFNLYKLRLDRQKIENELDAKIKNIKILHEYLGSEIKTLDQIDDQITAKRNVLASKEKELNLPPSDDESINSNTLIDLRNKVSHLRTSITNLKAKKEFDVYDLSDSEKFVESLSHRLNSLDESSKVINALSDIDFELCPSCFNKVDKYHNGCKLCGNHSANDSNKNPTFKVRKEIEFQIKESIRLISLKNERLAETELAINQAESSLITFENQLKSVEKPLTEISQKNRDLLISIGSLTNEIEELNKSKSIFSKLNFLYESRRELQSRLAAIEDQIEVKESSLEEELKRKKRNISSITLEILRADQEHEDAFKDGKKVDFNFEDDRVTIDDRALFSASSMAFLKNAFRLALLKASCEDSSYLYPRFLLMDNVEDKGMQESRSQLFQREIIRVSSSIKVAHQIIFTTSMIDPSLEGSPYCVGEFYDDTNKTLRLR